MKTWTVVWEWMAYDQGGMYHEVVEADSPEAAIRAAVTDTSEAGDAWAFEGEGFDGSQVIAAMSAEKRAAYEAEQARKRESGERAEYERLRAKYGG